MIKSGDNDMRLKLEQLYNATDNLIEQQFYLRGTDTIIGRTPEISIKIKNSGKSLIILLKLPRMSWKKSCDHNAIMVNTYLISRVLIIRVIILSLAP